MGYNLPFWPSEKQAGKPLHPACFSPPKTCNRCGYDFLWWRRVNGFWKLHHYADFSDGKGPRYVIHRCGYTSSGQKVEFKNKLLKGKV